MTIGNRGILLLARRDNLHCFFAVFPRVTRNLLRIMYLFIERVIFGTPEFLISLKQCRFHQFSVDDVASLRNISYIYPLGITIGIYVHGYVLDFCRDRCNSIDSYWS
ncbi:hypothetical protein QLX08_011381 [Tetragonisca angustula]|uniref:Uncharacterized protein n=1 Tax=Tetragonisca angustula TaxID=166442 RepID=A0AAW0Z8T8_9HYME